MNKVVCSIYDTKVEAFMQPFFVRSVGEAHRAFEELVNDGKSQPSIHAEDFALFQVGEFDEQNGHLIPLSTPKSLATAIQVKKEQKPG